MAGAISGTTIAAIAAMVAGAAMQYKAQTDAQKRRTEETQRSLARQDELQKQAEAKALGQAKEFNTDDRAQAQDAIEQELTQEFSKPVESAQQINSAQSTTQGNVSGDYTAAKAKSSVEQLKNAQALARLMAKTTAAGRLRGNEAIRMADTAAGIDRLGSFSRGQAGADQIAIQNAGTPDAGMQLAGGLLSAAGSYGLMSGGSAATGATAGGSGVSATNSGIGMQATGGTGLKMPKSFVW